jgi:hypothetical protein
MAVPVPYTEKKYVGRRDGVIPVNLTLTTEAVALLRQHAPSQKAYGQFIGQLLSEHDRQLAFQDFFGKEASRQLKKLCREIKKEANAS